MGKAKQRYEKLTWDGARATPLSADEEAARAMVALGGWECECGEPLNPKNGYTCCNRPRCPYCGVALEAGSLSGCRHFVVRFTHRWDLGLSAAFQHREGDTAASRAAWTKLIYPLAPARYLPGQPLGGYACWSAEQIAQAYPADIRAHLKAIFGPHLRTVNLERLCPVLLPVAQPDVKTTSGRRPARSEQYFSADPLAALARVEAFLTRLHEGTARLRALPPETWVQPSQNTPLAAVK